MNVHNLRLTFHLRRLETLDLEEMLFAKILSLSSSSPNAAARDNGSLSRLLYGRHAVVMACSASNRDRLRDIEFHSNGRQLCADRRHVFDHLSPDKFVRNVSCLPGIRILVYYEGERREKSHWMSFTLFRVALL